MVPPSMQDELRRSIRLLRHQPTPVRHILSAADFVRTMGTRPLRHHEATTALRTLECPRARSEVASQNKIKDPPRPQGTPGPSQRRTGRPRTPSARRSASGLPGVLGHGLRQRGGATGSRGRSQNSRPKSSPSLAGGTGFSPISPADRTDRTRSPLSQTPAPWPSPLLAARAHCPARIAALAMSRAVRKPACSCRRPRSMSKSGGAARGTRHVVGAIPPCNIGLRGP